MTTTEFHSHYEAVHHKLYAFAMKLAGNKADADDLMQETLMKAFAKKNQFRLGTNFKAWATTIMRNSFISEYRKKKARNTHSLYPCNYVLNEAPSSLMLQELCGMVKTLNDVQRTPFDLFFNGFTYEEIAQKLKLPMGTVKSRIFFARKTLKKLVGRNYGETYSLVA